ncbi:hypothetical protein J6590_102698 [Homalodisca vitripennis]|nr:hypothetical protein J6590_102698 [Homalodisca vitripennis]
MPSNHNEIDEVWKILLRLLFVTDPCSCIVNVNVEFSSSSPSSSAASEICTERLDPWKPESCSSEWIKKSEMKNLKRKSAFF